MKAGIAEKSVASICFSETPLRHLSRLSQYLPGRQFKLQPYGLVFDREAIVKLGGNPVWYTHMAKGTDWLIAEVDQLIQLGLRQPLRLVDGQPVPEEPARIPIAKIAPFVEWVIPGSKDFRWEREWRLCQNLPFSWAMPKAIVVPQADHQSFELAYTEAAIATGYAKLPPPLIAPEWGETRMLAVINGTHHRR